MDEQRSDPNYLIDTDKVCGYFKDQIGSFKELMLEKFERVFEHQDTVNKRMEERKREIDKLRTDFNGLENEFIQLKTEKDTSIRNTRWLVIGIGVLLAAIEVYILFSK